MYVVPQVIVPQCLVVVEVLVKDSLKQMASLAEDAVYDSQKGK